VAREQGSAVRGHSRVRPARPRGPKLVGRERELALLEAELAKAAAGELRCVLISGDPGLGKTRLAAEFLSRHASDVTGLFARGYPLATTTPFGLWADGLEPSLRGRSREEVRSLCGGFTDDLASLLHGVAAVAEPGAGREPPRLRVLEGLARLLDNLSGKEPMVAVLDDVHLADASSWELLRYLSRHLPEVRVLVLAIARPAELAGQDLPSQVLLDLERDELLTRLELDPLGREEVDRLAESLLEARPPAVLVDWLVERSRGNALFAIGLVRALMEEQADLTAPRLERLPEGLAQRAIARADRLGDRQRHVLELLAVIGRPIDFDSLASMSGQSPDSLARVLAALVSARALVEEERGGELAYQIHHPIVRDAVYQAIGGARRRLLHRQLARGLIRAGRLTEAAPHFARSAEVGDPEAIESLLEALRQAEQREAYREALVLLGGLVELLPVGDQRWLDVSDAMLLGAEWVVDHRADVQGPTAVRALRAIDALLDSSTDLGRRGAVKFRLASFLAWSSGELEEAEPVVALARQLFIEAGDHERALLAARELTWIRGLRGDLSGMEADARAVVHAATAAGERFVVLQGLAAIGLAATFNGDFDEADSVNRRAMAMAQADGKVYRLTAIQGTLAGSLAFQGRIAEARTLIDVAKSQNPDYRDSILLDLETKVHWIAGSFPAAVALAREALPGSQAGVSPRRVYGAVWGALSAVETGEINQAERFLALVRRGLDNRDWLVYAQNCAYAEAVLAWRRGHVLECLTKLRAVAARLKEMRAGLYLGDVLLDLAQAAAQGGEVAIAVDAADGLEELAGRLARDRYRGLAATASAWASFAGGDLERAALSAGLAVHHLSGAGCESTHGRALDILGRSLSGADRPGAMRALERAASHFESAGSGWRRDRSLEALRALGGAARRRAAAITGPASLSRREREVARLAVQGQTAREIAETLFLSERTVESHLTHAYAKLGVASKLDLVRRAGDLGL
jgi:DNA-binding CsgD family transcriptional regulator